MTKKLVFLYSLSNRDQRTVELRLRGAIVIDFNNASLVPINKMPGTYFCRKNILELNLCSMFTPLVLVRFLIQISRDTSTTF
jgi:hypothetical protein